MVIASKEQLLAADAERDRAICGHALATMSPERTRMADRGAHDPTPTPYFILEELLQPLGLTPDDHLLDVGCGAGRVLAYAAGQLPCRVTGVELDPQLASVAAAWAARFPRLDVIQGSVLEIPLAAFSHYYLFNPFDTSVLVAFLDKIEREAVRPVTLVHMSDNGETYAYLVRPTWRLVRDGSIQTYPSSSGHAFDVYAYPQHWSMWRYEPSA